MRIMWVMNSPIGPAASILGKEYKGSSGGWIQSEFEAIEKEENDFFFLSTLPDVEQGDILYKKNNIGEIYCIHALRLSYGIQTPMALQNQVKAIIDKVQPDIIQIWGTETWLSNAVSKCKTSAPKIIFIQGLIGVHQRYLGGYFGNDREERKFFRGIGCVSKAKALIRSCNYRKQALIEKDTIANCQNVIVDSDFAKAYCFSISEKVQCFHHTLLPNDLFYHYHWSLDECKRHTIFTVYGSSAEKGTQNLLKAISIVKRRYADVRIVIPGNYQLDENGKLQPSKNDAFQNVIYNMISDMNLEDNVSFTGRLNPIQMAETMAKCHVFVNPSCMEVHALSLREALIVGLPCISSHCGSVAEYLFHKDNGFLYRYEEYETLAYYIMKIFNCDRVAQRLSERTITSMDNIKQGNKNLNEIYACLLSKETDNNDRQ